MIGTAIFSTPSSIAASVGSAGASLALWLVGLVLSYCGMLIWIELGWLMPRSGGEKIYLEAAYPRPPMLITTMFAVHVVCLGFTGAFSSVDSLLGPLRLTVMYRYWERGHRREPSSCNSRVSQ